MPLFEHQKSIVDETAAKCFAKVQEMSSQDDKDPTGDNRALHTYIFCMARDFVKSCPTEMQDNSPRCAKIREGKEKPVQIEENEPQ